MENDGTPPAICSRRLGRTTKAEGGYNNGQTPVTASTVDPSFGQNLWGRPTVVVTGQPGCPVINFNPTVNASGFSQMYSYTAAGLMTKKRLRWRGAAEFQGISMPFTRTIMKVR